MKNPEKAKRDRFALLLLTAGTILTLLLLALPLYRFSAGIYTKKSSNTFPGDEKYQEARAEVEEAAQKYRDSGMEVEIGEEVTERTNSKGETTSLITFTVKQSFTRNGFAFLTSSLPSAWALRGLCLGLFLALFFCFLGAKGSLGTDLRHLPAPARRLRGLGCVSLLCSLLLVPVFVFMSNYGFWRRTGLCQADLLTEGKEEWYALLDAFLFEGRLGEEAGSALKKLGAAATPQAWLLAGTVFVALLGAVCLRFGTFGKPVLRGLLYAFILAVCVITLFPYYVMLITAFRSNAEALDMYFLHLLPTKWLWGNLQDILNRGVLTYLKNSLFVAGGATALAMLCGIPAAFAMARMQFKGKKFFLGFVIMSQMFSPVVLLIGISQLMNTLRLNDTLWGLIFVNAAFNQAFAIWLLRGTFVAISPEMEQAARIDGCSTMGSLVRILLPMAAPGIVTTLIFVFINAWNEYTISTVLISTAAKRPITVGITQFSSFNMIEWQYLFAASLLATIPVVLLFMGIEKHLTGGLTSGGVKG